MKRISGLAIGITFGAATLVAGAMAGQTTSTNPSASAPPGGTMHMESTTKHTGPGPNTKVKTETVIGSVKTYEAGKKITVVGPKKKDYSFDLDENVAMSGGAVKEGDKVKVTYTKDNNGMKATTVAPYTGKSTKTSKKAA